MLLPVLMVLLSCSGKSDSSGGSCGSFSACGGNLDGTWQFDDLCTEGDLVAALNSDLSSMPAACQNMIKTVTMDVSGTVTYSSGVETADLELISRFTAVYPQECLSALEESPVAASAEYCSALAEDMTSAGADDGTSATCTVADSGCSCAATLSQSSEPEAHNYTIQGNTLVYDDDDSIPAEYCVQGDRLTRRSTDSEYGISMIATAHRI
jgi:hypothetical protein